MQPLGSPTAWYRSRTATGTSSAASGCRRSAASYFENLTPVTGQPFTEIARSTAEDIELALDAAHGAKHAWGRTSAAERANLLNKIADRIEANLEMLAVAETWENGKPIRETLAADLPLAVDHFRYFAGAIRAQEGGLSEIDERHHRLPLPRAARRGRRRSSRGTSRS